MSAKLKELREQLKTLHTKAKEVADKFDQESRSWKNPEDEQAFASVNADFDAVKRQIEDETAAEKVAEGINKQLQDMEDFGKQTNEHVPGLEDFRQSKTPKSGEVTEETRALAFAAWCRSQMDEDIDDRHINACRAVGMNPMKRHLTFNIGTTQQYRSFAGEFRRTSPMHRDAWQAESRALSAFAAASGGATVPQSFVRSLEVNMLAFGGVRQVADMMITGTGERMSWPTADDTSNEGEQVGESSNLDNSGAGGPDPSFGLIYWDAYKFSSKAVLVPFELLEDSFLDLPSVLGEMLGERLGRITAKRHTTGTGANTAKGIVTNAALGVTAASQTAITFDEIIDLEHSIDPAYRANAGYMLHDNVLLHLRKLKDGDGNYLWQVNSREGAPDLLNRRPYAISMEMDSAVTTGKKTVLFGQLNRHKIRRVNQVRLYRMEERYRENDQDGFVAMIREDSNTLKTSTAPIKYLQQA